MLRRPFALICLATTPAFVASCSSSVPTETGTAGSSTTAASADCISLDDAVAVANASNLSKLAEQGVDTNSYPYSYTADSTNLLACDGGVTVLDTGLRDGVGESVPIELHRYLIARDSDGAWRDATDEYTVGTGDRFVGMDCAKMPPKVAAQYRRVAAGEQVPYPSLACAPPTDLTRAQAQQQRLRVGEVPGQPAATAALQAWADDFVAGNVAELERNCWTIAPERVRGMYADSAAIEQAIAQPGIDGQFAFVWQNPTTRISVKRSEIASGYACPYVSPQDDVHIYNSDDARYLVVRYLMRVTGSPVNVWDTEANYPLECAGWTPTDMSDTSRSIAATTTSFDRDSIEMSGGPDEWQVVVHGKSTDGDDRVYRYSTNVGHEGPCIAEVA